ncbi:ABC transporter ATP-binding protein [Levilactobacillus yiduensis]|uniref:ABC transporter ATP-binding protein n=1 Tax=Levilactobacillus yiduensis TaxID=2953880 RepID=UPI000EF317E1|nr:ABC transporter ATP-binding protein [Levilactobacillus yiduensis]AYM02576.1 ABC transporter ATP-binding protein [Levilactobacillus brevis]
MATVTVHALTFTYPKRTQPVLDDLDVTFPSGKFSLLTGVSGGGKSTLLKLIAGLTPLPDAGAITFDGQPLAQIAPAKRAATVAMLFQEPSTQFTMDTVVNELRFALENQQVDPAAIPAKVTAALDFIGITDLRDRQLMQLSGGEQQKVALAIIVAMDSDVILLDEPFASIDPPTRLALLEKLVTLCTQRGKTIILADHDLSNYDRWVDHLAVLDTGKLTLLSPAATQARFAAFTPDKLRLTHVALPADDLTVSLQGTQLALGHAQRQLLQPQDLSLFAHQATLITGPNGSGKSTLFRALVRLGNYQGRITYDGQDIHKLSRKRYARQVGLMFQSASAQFLNVTVAEELALSQKFGNQTYFTPERVQDLLTQLHLANHVDQVIYSLSSGQQKKLQLLCMLMMAPNVLLLDEPLKGLDFASIQVVMQILTTVQRDLKLTLIMISHQLSGLDDLITLHLALDHQQLTYQEATT